MPDDSITRRCTCSRIVEPWQGTYCPPPLPELGTAKTCHGKEIKTKSLARALPPLGSLTKSHATFVIIFGGSWKLREGAVSLVASDRKYREARSGLSLGDSILQGLLSTSPKCLTLDRFLLGRRIEDHLGLKQ